MAWVRREIGKGFALDLPPAVLVLYLDQGFLADLADRALRFVQIVREFGDSRGQTPAASTTKWLYPSHLIALIRLRVEQTPPRGSNWRRASRGGRATPSRMRHVGQKSPRKKRVRARHRPSIGPVRASRRADTRNRHGIAQARTFRLTTGQPQERLAALNRNATQNRGKSVWLWVFPSASTAATWSASVTVLGPSSTTRVLMCWAAANGRKTKTQGSTSEASSAWFDIKVYFMQRSSRWRWRT